MKTGPKMQSSKSSHHCRLDDVYPRLNLVNVVVRPLLFTKMSLFTKLSLDKEYNMKKGAEVYSLNQVFH